MDYEFEEDVEPTWLIKQREDAILVEKSYNKNEKQFIKKDANGINTMIK